MGRERTPSPPWKNREHEDIESVGNNWRRHRERPSEYPRGYRFRLWSVLYAHRGEPVWTIDTLYFGLQGKQVWLLDAVQLPVESL